MGLRAQFSHDTLFPKRRQHWTRRRPQFLCLMKSRSSQQGSPSTPTGAHASAHRLGPPARRSTSAAPAGTRLAAPFPLCHRGRSGGRYSRLRRGNLLPPIRGPDRVLHLEHGRRLRAPFRADPPPALRPLICTLEERVRATHSRPKGARAALGALIQRNIVARPFANVNLAWASDFLLRIGNHFLPLRDPADRARHREKHGEH